jgi:gamma-aminobutyric acid receptor subunit beta
MSLGYDKRVRPNYGGPPVEVNVTMRILSISSVSEVMMDFTADFYFRQTWHDPRLSFKKLGDIQTLYVGAEVSKKIWLPDTFFGNEKMVSLLAHQLASSTIWRPARPFPTALDAL